MVLGCFGLGSVCGSWLGGWLTDRFGNFKVQTTSLIMVIPMFLLLPLFRTFEGLALMIFLTAVIMDTFRPANSVSVARYAKPENITRAYSLNRMAVNLGFSIGPALGGFLATISYNWIFYGNAIAAALAAVVFIYFFRNRKGNQATRHNKETNAEKPGKSAYSDGLFITFNFFCFLFAVAFFQLISTLPLFYKEAHQMASSQIGLILGFSGFVIVLFEMILIHTIEHKLSIRSIMLSGTAITGLAYGMLVADYGLGWLYLSIFMLSIGEMLVLPFTATVAISRANSQNQGAYMGFSSLAFAASNIFSPYLGTYTAEHYGYTTLWTATAIILLISSVGFYWSLTKMKTL